MSSKKLRSRSQSVDRAGSIQGNMDEDSPTDFSQEGRIMVGEIRDSEGTASNTNLENTNQENPITNPNSNEQSSNISRYQLQEFLNIVMQGIKAESAKQTAALQEVSEKQTAKLTAESAKLTSSLESLKSEIKEENERLANSLAAKFEAAHDKIREDFEAKLSSEIITVSEKIDNVRKDNEGKISKLSSTIDEVYDSVSEKIDTNVNQTKEAIDQIREYVDDKFRAVLGDRRQVSKNADEISKAQATLGELQNKIASVSFNTPQSADSGNTIVRVISTDQQAASTSSGLGANIFPSTNGVSVSSNPACHDSTSIVSQTSNSGVYTNVNVTSEERNRSVDLNELTLPLFTDSSKQVPLHFIRDLDLYFRLKQTPDYLKLPLTFRAVQEPIAKQWFSSTYDKLNCYDEFRKGFTDLLWNPNRQEGIRSQIYLDKHTQNSGESYVDLYIRYANLASSLDPPMTDMDLLSALTSHYEPRGQQSLLCGNF